MSNAKPISRVDAIWCQWNDALVPSVGCRQCQYYARDHTCYIPEEARTFYRQASRFLGRLSDEPISALTRDQQSAAQEAIDKVAQLHKSLAPIPQRG